MATRPRLSVLMPVYNEGRIFRRKTISATQIRMYEILMPLARIMEHIPFLPALSLIAVGRKK